ncbi:MAG: phosphopyruvate hydratase, partial [Acidimicrobiales bacterium]
MEVTVALASGAGVPAGASTGSLEAAELRDRDPMRYGGDGVVTAVGHVNADIDAAVSGRDWQDLAELDQALIDLDGTATKAR